MYIKLQLWYKKVFYLRIWFSKGLTARGKGKDHNNVDTVSCHQNINSRRKMIEN